MKKIINLLFIIPLLVTLASCYEDKGNYDYINLPDIAIKAKDTVNVTQLHTLEIPADVNLNGEAETDYEFSWRIWSNNIGGIDQQKIIGNTRNLTYKVTEVPGTYTLVLTVRNKITDVKSYKQIHLVISGSITEGWMVLQEKDGKSDFDLIMSPYFSNRVSTDEILHNCYEAINGEPLVGRGVKIGSFFALGRYQEVIVLTDKDGVLLSAVTMQKTYDISTLMYDMSSWKPENYIAWKYGSSPCTYAFDGIISNGRIYEYQSMPSSDFPIYTEPILKDGTYKASPYVPKHYPIWRYQGVIYDEENGRFLSFNGNTWVLQELPVATEIQPFDWGNMHATLRYMETGYNNHEYGLFEDWTTHKLTLCVFNFMATPNIGVGKYTADNCPELQDARYYAVGSLGPVFLYATDRNIYRYDYNGTNTGEKIYTLANPDEKITGMKIFKPCIDLYIPSHPYNNKILIISTYNTSKKEGKIYMYHINETNGTIDISSEKTFEGFGEILDMEYNYPKYGV